MCSQLCVCVVRICVHWSSCCGRCRLPLSCLRHQSSIERPIRQQPATSCSSSHSFLPLPFTLATSHTSGHQCSASQSLQLSGARMEQQADDSAGEEGVQHMHSSIDHKSPDSTTSAPPPLVDEDPTNLIVNYIPIAITEDQLRTLFSPFGLIERVKIVMDRLTGLSLGYGFVKYNTLGAAQHAITALNGYQLHNKRLKVSVSKPPTTDKKTNLYISGLPQHWTEAELTRLVTPYGTVVNVRLLYDAATHRCKGVGFAKFEAGASAATAIAALTGQTVDGGVMPLIVKYADTTSDKVRKAMAAAGGAAVAAAVGGVGGAAGVQTMMARQLLYGQYAHTPAALAALAQQQQQQQQQRAGATDAGNGNGNGNGYYAHAGNGISASASNSASPLYLHHPTHQPTPLQAGLNHASTLTSSASTSSLSSSSLSPPPLPSPPTSHPHAHQQQPHPLQSSPTLHPHPEFTGVCLFVYHLPLEASESTLFSLFSAYGQVTSARVMRDLLTGRSKGFGFVNVSRHEEAAAAIEGLNGFQLGNKYLKVAYKK